MSADTFFHQSFLKTDTFFNRDYHTARNSFMQANQALPKASCFRTWSLSKSLHCGTIWLGDLAAKNVVVVISGTHGIEGYCGSAVQNFILQAVQQKSINIPKDCACLLIHALNPWGMAHFRRCDQDGIDLNRNFVDFSVPLPENKDYLAYLEQLVSAAPNERYQTFVQLSDQLGQQHFDKIFSGGQYDCSWGPFYGGQQAAWSNHVIDQIIAHYALAARRLAVIDIHSGLGPWAFGELISDHDPNSAGDDFSTALFGSSISKTLSGESFSVPKKGLLDYRWHQLMQSQGCFVTLEFGSYGTEALFNTLLDDHLLWRDATKVSDTQAAQQAQDMLEHFSPNDQLWRQAVLFKGWQVIRHALTNLSEVCNDYA